MYPHQPDHQHTTQRSERDAKAPTPKHPLPITNRPPHPPHVRLIPLEQIFPNPHQPRKQFEEASLQELAESIRQYGILQPLLVCQRDNERFELIAGERRFRAAQLLGLPYVPAIVRKYNESEQAEISLIENLQREDLSPVEMARAFRTLMDDFKLTQQQIADRVGKSRSTITHVLRLLQLSDEMLNSLDSGEIQEAHALTLLQVEDEAIRERLFQQIRTEKLSQKELRQRVRLELGEVAEPNPKQSEDRGEVHRAQLARMTPAALSEELRQKFSRQVVIQCSRGMGGQVTMHFRNPEDLIALVDTLLSAPG